MRVRVSTQKFWVSVYTSYITQLTTNITQQINKYLPTPFKWVDWGVRIAAAKFNNLQQEHLVVSSIVSFNCCVSRRKHLGCLWPILLLRFFWMSWCPSFTWQESQFVNLWYSKCTAHRLSYSCWPRESVHQRWKRVNCCCWPGSLMACCCLLQTLIR